MSDQTKLIDGYIKSKAASWSESTQKSERSRLRGITIEMLEWPQALYDYLKGERNLKPYPMKTTFVRAGEFAEHLISKGEIPGPNKVKSYMRDNQKLFKYVDHKKEIEITFDEAAKLINEKLDGQLRAKALQLLYTGLRVTESKEVKDGVVVGKGGIVRDVPLASDFKDAEEFSLSMDTLRRALKPLGLTPHDLRRLCATQLVAMGADIPDLMKYFGWRSPAMAARYVQAHKQKELALGLKQKLKGRRGKQVPR